MPNVRPFCGCVDIPPDKSISHRALMMASMADGVSHLRNLLNSQDVRSTARCMSALGAKVHVTRCSATSFDADVTGWGSDGPSAPSYPLDCGNSGTTARLMLGMLASYDVRATLTGDASLSKRPMQRVVQPLAQMGARFEFEDGSPWTEGAISLPLAVQGSSQLQAIEYASPKASAQVKTCIMLAALRADGVTRLSEPFQSRNHTELMLPAFGANVGVEPLKVSVQGGQQLRCCDLVVPGDPSSAMFLAVAASLVPDSQVTIRNMGLNPTRTAGFSVARRMGCSIESTPYAQDSLEPAGDVLVKWTGQLVGTQVAAREVPNLIDEIPILALLATAAEGQTCFEEVSELRVKESNRLEAIVSGLTALGCNASEQGDNLLVQQGVPTADVELDSRGDHRLAMTWVLANRCFGLDGSVAGTECIDVSFPGFAGRLDNLQKGELR